MGKFASVRRVIWAVDAFEPPGPVIDNCVTILRYLREKLGARVEPVHVLSPAELNLAMEFPSFSVEPHLPSARGALACFLQDHGLEDFETPSLIPQTGSGQRSAASALARHAERIGADWIVVGTHSRRGLSRLLLGSFAETLLLQARIPVLTVNGSAPQMERGSEPGVIFMPVDLSTDSRSVFEQAVAVAATLGARLHLLHSVPNPVAPLLQSGAYLIGGGWMPVHNFFADEIVERRKKAEAWTAWALRRGVIAEYHVHEIGGSVVATIIDRAKLKGATLIAVGAQTGRVSAALIGSVVREVVRESPAPVLVLHPRRVARSAGLPSRAA